MVHAEFILEIAVIYQEGGGVNILSEKMEWFRKAGSFCDIMFCFCL